MTNQGANISGFCKCGCGQRTNLSPKTDRGRGHVKGKPMRFVRGHGAREPEPPVLRPPIVPIGPSIAYIPLTKGEFALVDIEDLPEIGRWNWSAFWIRNKKCFGAHRAGRRGRAGARPPMMMHQVIMPLTNGTIPDHINGNSLDNRRVNLRAATNRQNLYNSRLRADNSTGKKGVTFIKHKGVYAASIKVMGKTRYLGQHKTCESAHEAYCKAAIEIAGEFARFA